MKFLVLIALFFVLYSMPTRAMVEISANYSYSKQIYGAENLTNDDLDSADKSIARTYQVVWNWYIWNYTAIDINYSRELTEVNQTADDGTDEVIVMTKLEGETTGIGLRQSFAGKDAFFRPSLSIGYAKQKFNTSKHYRINGTSLNPIVEYTEYDSTYVTLSFRLAFSKLMGVTFGGTTVVPGTDFDLASRNLKYFAGFSWIF